MSAVKAADGVRVRKLGERVAERIIAEIVARGWPVGENLGAERELLVRYGISRATFREAIRQVEQHGAAHMRRGAGGGLIVAKRPRAAAVRAMVAFFELTHVSFADQHEVRETLEVAAARLAAERITAAKAADLAQIVESLRSETDYVRNVAGNMQVRVGVAEATGNPALALFIEALNGVQREILKALRFDESAFQLDRTQSVDFKHRLVQALTRHDADEAERLVHEDANRRLLAMTSAFTRTATPDPSVDPHQALPVWWEADEPPHKLSDRVVYRIINDIAKLGWKVGHNLGREADLQPRYQVSRAVLREAIRQLELHGIATMKAGLQGGLIISRVDPAYTVELVTTYLRSTPFDVLHIWETQSAIQVFAAMRLAQRADAEDRQALRAAMDALRDARLDAYIERANVLHREISDRTGNRVISLFNRVLIRNALEFLPPVPEPARVWLVDMHQKVVDAICAGDFRSAEREMTEIFRRSGRWFAQLGDMEK